MNVKRIRVKRPHTDTQVKRVRHYGEFLSTGDAVAIVGHVGVWTVERFESDSEGTPLAVIMPVVIGTEPRSWPRKVKLKDVVPLRLEHIEEEVSRVELALSSLERIAQDLRYKEVMREDEAVDGSDEREPYVDDFT